MRSLRGDALTCIEAALGAVDPEILTHRWFTDHPQAVSSDGRLVLVAIGKAAAGMVRGAVRAIDEQIEQGVVLLPEGTELGLQGHLRLDPTERFEVYRGGHPVPNQEGVRGAQAIHDLASGLGENDLLLALVSGGGSSLMTLPPEGVSLDDLQRTTEALLHAGADIQEVNTVRKHLDGLKGGRLARLAYPARTLALVLSDVVGDRLDTIASGPVTGDRTTYSDALDVIDRWGISDQVPRRILDHLHRGRAGAVDESPRPDDPMLQRAAAHIIGSNRMAARAAKTAAESLGYRTLILSAMITGEARHVGEVLAALGIEILRIGAPLEPPACLIAGGETTVTVTGAGTGGRNQEVALGAAVAMDKLISSRDEAGQVLVAAVGTDGTDGPTSAAGAAADGTTIERAREHDLDPARSLAANDAYPFFRTLGDLIELGPTGTNVMDLVLVLVGELEAE